VWKNAYPSRRSVVENFCETESMMKSAFVTVISLLAMSCAVFGQTPNVPVIKIEAPDIVAEVNGDKISRSSLAAECLQLHGTNELQELIGNTLIRLECEQQRITVMAVEINAEILRMAQTFKMTSEQWLQELEERRGISPEQYRQDVVWRILALGKLAGQRLVITDAELQAEYEKHYGAAVQVRQIVLTSRAEAEAVLAAVKQNPEAFASFAKNRSVDPVTQPLGGMLHPIRRHSYDPNVENILFAMKTGEISNVVDFPLGHFSIYKCEGQLQPHDVDFDVVRQQLRLQMRDKKLRQVADELFLELQSRAKVQLVFGNPALYSRFPGVAAILNEQTIISQQELADRCIQKYGREVLGDIINRRIVEQACRRENIIISEQDIDNEIREMAFKYLPLLPNGAPNIELWLKRATEENGLSIPMYRKNVIVPVLSLKRLTRNMVQITEEEIQLAFEANYGQKVRCLAIFFEMNNQRQATEVWQMANRHKTEEAFSDLAARYSFHPESRLGKGVIPPIARHTGNPELERVAFSLKPGEISHIVQVEDYLVMLYCVGYVEPLPVKMEEVKVDLVANLFERKQQIIVSRYFGELYKQAVWNNYLTGESRNPVSERAVQGEANLR
jgi:parvulin-like peptidyl-prolyl isomerase